MKDPDHSSERPMASRRGSGAPIGTHSLTGSQSNVGLPPVPHGETAERSSPRDEADTQEPDLLIEPRATRGDLLGRKG